MSTANAPSVYTPGAMNQNISSDITSVAWNRKVIHVLATATYSGTTIIWDLRAKRPAVTFADPSRRNKCKAIAWSPEQPTIIATSSEEDENPVVQLWDLTNAFAPVKVRNFGLLLSEHSGLLTPQSTDSSRPLTRRALLILVSL
jgi:protein transport protein SEC31